jgi:hypothetical protein
MEINGVYGVSKLPDNILWVKDSLQNRLLFENEFGETKLKFDDYAYIEFNTIDRTWNTTFSFQWLYTNQPPLTDINELIEKYKLK